MKLTLSCLLFFITSSTWAQCYLYKIKAQVVRTDDQIEVVVNEKTRAEVKLTVPHKLYPPLIPYIDRTISGDFILKYPVERGSEVLGVSNIKKEVPDPLNHKKHSYLKKGKAVPCPSI
jgi:hypothetical protein